MTDEPLEPLEPPEDQGPPSSEPARPVDRWRHNTASGAVAAALALGLQEVFDPAKKDTIAIEQEVPDKPVEPGQVELNFHPTDFRATSIVIRPPEPPASPED